jgi:hypothetical protein
MADRGQITGAKLDGVRARFGSCALAAMIARGR